MGSFGSKADAICNDAGQRFCQLVPRSNKFEHLRTERKKDLERSLDTQLRGLFVRQLGKLRQAEVDQFYQRDHSFDMSADDRMVDPARVLGALDSFQKEARSSQRVDAPGWGYEEELKALRRDLDRIWTTGQHVHRAYVSTQRQSEQAILFMQQQYLHMQAIQQQVQANGADPATPWNAGLTYRLPNTNFQISGNYQQGHAAVQVTCVPDQDNALGPDGFVNGLSPGNVGLSCTVTV